MDQKKYVPPEAKTPREAFEEVSAKAAGTLTLTGSAGEELVKKFMGDSFEKRLLSWRKDLAAGLRELEQQHAIQAKQLEENEEFKDALTKSLLPVLFSSSEAKRVAARNAVLNSALPSSPKGFRHSRFMRHVQEYDVLHFQVLELLANPTEWFALRNQTVDKKIYGTISRTVYAAFPGIFDADDVLQTLLTELHSDGLVSQRDPVIALDAGGDYPKLTTSLGERFLRFIQAPPK